jgi:hypothetical protein
MANSIAKTGVYLEPEGRCKSASSNEIAELSQALAADAAQFLLGRDTFGDAKGILKSQSSFRLAAASRMLVRIERIFAIPREPTTRTVSPGLSFTFISAPLHRSCSEKH